LFLDRGFSQRNIEKETGINRRTIAGYLKRFGESGFSFRELLLFEDSELEVYLNADKAPRGQTDPRRSELEALFPYMLSELRKVGVTRLLLWQEYNRLVSRIGKSKCCMIDIPMVAEAAAIAYIQRMIVDAKIANRDMLISHSTVKH